MKYLYEIYVLNDYVSDNTLVVNIRFI